MSMEIPFLTTNLQNLTFVNFALTIFEFRIIQPEALEDKNLFRGRLPELQRIDS